MFTDNQYLSITAVYIIVSFLYSYQGFGWNLAVACGSLMKPNFSCEAMGNPEVVLSNIRFGNLTGNDTCENLKEGRIFVSAGLIHNISL